MAHSVAWRLLAGAPLAINAFPLKLTVHITPQRIYVAPFQDYNDDIRQEQLREMQMMNSAGGGAGVVANSGGGGGGGCGGVGGASGNGGGSSASSNGSCGSGPGGGQDVDSVGGVQQQHLAAVRSVAGLTPTTAPVMTLANPLHQHLTVKNAAPVLYSRRQQYSEISCADSEKKKLCYIGAGFVGCIISNPRMLHGTFVCCEQAMNHQSAGMAAPLRTVAYPPVLPLMHPALRGLCKPSQSLAIGLTAAGINIYLENRNIKGLFRSFTIHVE